MQHDAAVAVDGVQHFFRRRAQRGDDDRNLMLHAHFHVMGQAVIGLVHDLVDGDRADALVRVRGLEFGQLFLQIRQPHIQQLGRTRIQRRERADDAGLALRRHQRRTAGNEHRRSDDRKGEVLQDCRQGHGGLADVS
jgi:hypothetical protein